MPSFDLVLSRTNYPGLRPRAGAIAAPTRSILPPAALASDLAVTLVRNVVIPRLQPAPRIWYRTVCDPLTGVSIPELYADLAPHPDWLETGLGVLGQWGTVSLATLGLAALGGAAVAPASLLIAGGAALVGTVGSLALSHTRQAALETREQTIQLAPTSNLSIEVLSDSSPCVEALPPPAPPPLAGDGGDSDCGIALPEWWPARPGANRPQLVIIFARVKEDGALDRTTLRTTTIPHYVGPQRLTTSPISDHERGQWLAELTLLDNSRIRCFGSSPAVAIGLVEQARAVVNPDYVPPSAEPSVKKMEKDTMYKKINVRPIKAIFYPRGQRIEDEGGAPIVSIFS